MQFLKTFLKREKMLKSVHKLQKLIPTSFLIFISKVSQLFVGNLHPVELHLDMIDKDIGRGSLKNTPHLDRRPLKKFSGGIFSVIFAVSHQGAGAYTAMK